MSPFRVVVARPPGAAQSRQQVDALDCAAWSARARRSVAALEMAELCRQAHGRRQSHTGGRG